MLTFDFIIAADNYMVNNLGSNISSRDVIKIGGKAFYDLCHYRLVIMNALAVKLDSGYGTELWWTITNDLFYRLSLRTTVMADRMVLIKMCVNWSFLNILTRAVGSLTADNRPTCWINIVIDQMLICRLHW